MPSIGVPSLSPARAIVVPRGSPAAGGEVLPLETWVRNLYRDHPVIAIVGPSGSGKSTAIRHLAHTLFETPVRCLDHEPAPAEVATIVPFVFAASSYSREFKPNIVLQIAPWTESERVDYLLAKHPTRIRSIMKRLETCDCIDELEGSPRLWCAVLDWMARDESPTDVRELLRAIYRHTLKMLQEGEAFTRTLLATCYQTNTASPELTLAPSLLWHPMMMRFAVTDNLLREIKGDATKLRLLKLTVDDLSLDDLARQLRSKPDLQARLLDRIELGEQALMPTGVSVALMLDPSYRPPPNALNLQNVRAVNAKWMNGQFAGANLNGADLRCADLAFAELVAATAERADFSRANLHAANLKHCSLKHAQLREATFASAILEQANLTHASAQAANFNHAVLDGSVLVNADLFGASFIAARMHKVLVSNTRIDACDFTRAELYRAILTGVDLRATIFDYASLEGASLARANLESLTIRDLRANSAFFASAQLTGASLQNASLANANFSGAELADIDLEEADLHDANFDNAAFHMGTSRSGMVDSPIACEGSRTGFYTDDAGEIYKHPEEIRKANLCGANLIGASVFKTDWYLVDLRGAKYTSDQARWFNKCRAILFDRR